MTVAPIPILIGPAERAFLFSGTVKVVVTVLSFR